MIMLTPIGGGRITRNGEIIPPTYDEPPVPPPDLRRNLNDLVQTVWRWRRYFFLIFFGILFLGLIGLFLLPIKYTAQALAMIGSREPSVLAAEPSSGSQPRDLDVEGTIQVMTSPLSMNKVIDDLQLLQQPEFEKLARNASPGILVRLRSLLGAGEPSSNPLAVVREAVERNLKVDRVGRSSFVVIKFTSADPQLAARVVNSVASNTAADDAFLRNLTVAERAGFEFLRVWLVSPAAPPIAPSSPNVVLVLGVSIGAGLLAALSGVLFADYYALRKVTNADQIARHGLRSLGFIPTYADSGEGAAVRTVSERPQEAFSDSIAALRASLLSLVPREGSSCLVLLFTSAASFEGKSTTAAALAASIAISGGRVLLIDADLRAPSLHRVFGASMSTGLANLLDTAEPALDRMIQVDSRSGVHLLAAGSKSSHPIDILTSKRFADAIATFRRSFDFILIDTPPVLATSDALTVVPIVDYCVFVVRWGKTAWETVSHALRLLTDAGAKIAGMAVSRVDRRQFTSNSFYYRY